MLDDGVRLLKLIAQLRDVIYGQPLINSQDILVSKCDDVSHIGFIT